MERHTTREACRAGSRSTSSTLILCSLLVLHQILLAGCGCQPHPVTISIAPASPCLELAVGGVPENPDNTVGLCERSAWLVGQNRCNAPLVLFKNPAQPGVDDLVVQPGGPIRLEVTEDVGPGTTHVLLGTLGGAPLAIAFHIDDDEA